MAQYMLLLHQDPANMADLPDADRAAIAAYLKAVTP